MKPSGRVFAFGVGGMVVWVVHLLAIYGLTSAAERWAGETSLAVRALIAALTLAALALDLMLMRAAFRRRLPVLAEGVDEHGPRFWRTLGGIGAAISLIAVLFQTAPILMLE